MRLAQIAAGAAVLVSLVTASTTSAQIAVEARPLEPRRIVPMLGCEMRSFTTGYGVWIFNLANVPYTLPQGTQIQWSASNGLGGSFTIGMGGLGSGEGILVGTSGSLTGCSAGVV